MDDVISWWSCQYLSRRQSYRFIAFHTQGKNAPKYTRNVYVQTKQMYVSYQRTQAQDVHIPSSSEKKILYICYLYCFLLLYI